GWADRRRPRPRLGARKHHHRPDPCRDGEAVAAAVPDSTPRSGRRSHQGSRGLRPGVRDRRRRLMAGSKNTESVKQITYLAGALKAPRITAAASRMADQARDAGWSFEDYLAAVLEREVSARNASGAELRIKAAGFAARKTLEDFDWDAQP